MAKDIEEIPELKEKEKAETQEPAEPDMQEEGKMQLVTSEQLTQFKLDNLGLEVQETNSKIQELIEILRKKK